MEIVFGALGMVACMAVMCMAMMWIPGMVRKWFRSERDDSSSAGEKG